jgi:alcohol dehydrogenase (cytochrome c)
MRLKLLATLMAIGFATGTAQAVVTQQMIDNDASDTKEVLSWGMGNQGQRFSTLKQVNPQSIKSRSRWFTTARCLSRVPTHAFTP